MPALDDILRRGRQVEEHRPWPRVVVDEQAWRAAGEALAQGSWSLIGLWGEPDAVHMALLEEPATRIAVLTLEAAGRFPSIGRLHPPALRLERALHDLYGLQPEDSPDPRPWLDHGRWDVRHPQGLRPDHAATPAAYAFLPTEGESLHRIPVGPVHAGIIEPGHFRFTANGETVVRLEERLGYVHKGIESLMAGAPIDRAARLAGHVSGDSTVAYALAFARAVEAALDLEVPARAVCLRALMAELERMANHFGDFGAVCNDAAFALMHAHCGALRERVLRAGDACFGHRLMMDRIIPGGVSVEPTPEGIATLRSLLVEVRQRFPRLIELYDNTASLQNRTVDTGFLSPALARQYAAGGYVGRASGRGFDARRMPGYAPYPSLRFEVPVLSAGDVNARVWIRIREIEQSLALIEQILAQLPEGPIQGAGEAGGQGSTCEGMALVEGFRGDVLAWVRISSEGRIARCHLRDPSWFQWPLLEAAIEGNIVADFPLCNKSFNCSYSGHDL
jgi:Ni,Fe-hydrogenase III large subunit/Ni,Fe-hydrogenase III component G